ncbi:nucleoprotein [Hymenopteran chu-related virus OKIAV147]|uniref:Nucleoprotein n=1 Tax=Hymenopteran chu-related virus OKIAV147 TaxID=2789449 RepID=A0A7U3NUL2_9VIRU|nr:nucleoprotein [Hymenopteran chu-related virus OKIAV147]QPB73972.1 nucleoprotein [Hymenopteran chu-related virus OKIAV147]
MFLILMLLGSTPIATAILAYDCSKPSRNSTTISLVEIGPCAPPPEPMKVETVKIQLLQVKDYKSVPAYSCRVKLTRIVAKCGYITDAVDLPTGSFASYYPDITASVCHDMVRYGTYVYNGYHRISDIKKNSLKVHAAILSGSSNVDGDCSGSSFSDRFGSWDRVTVHATFEILVQEFEATTSTSSNDLSLPDKHRCALDDETCFTESYGHAFWAKPVPSPCGQSEYTMLYAGYSLRAPINPMYNHSELNSVYTVSDQHYGFALAVKSSFRLCGFTIYHTEQPTLYIVDTTISGELPTDTSKVTHDFDWSIYTNSKFVYLERHFSTEVTQMYNIVREQRCELERKMLEHSTMLAMLAPDEFAMTIMKRPGFIAYQAGEQLHIHECVPVDVTLWRTTECHKELSVNHSGVQNFRSPKTHILRSVGTVIPCSHLAPSAFLLNDKWVEFSPEPRMIIGPVVLTPDEGVRWQYTNIEGLATVGIYTQKDLNDLRHNIMFPLDRQAVSASFESKILNNYYEGKTLDFSSGFTEKSLESLGHKLWTTAWGKFIMVGNIMSGLIGVYTFVVLIRYTIDTVVNMMILHDLYGFGSMLLCGLWNSLTSFAMHKYSTKERTKRDPEEDPTSGVTMSNLRTEEDPRAIVHASTDHDGNKTNRNEQCLKVYPSMV